MTNQNRTNLSFGSAMLFAGALSTLGWFVIWPRYSNAIHVDVAFDDAGGVHRGDYVRMSGVDVGFVDGISITRDHKAQLSLSLNRNSFVPVGSQFYIAPASANSEASLKVMPSDSQELLADGAAVNGRLMDQCRASAQ